MRVSSRNLATIAGAILLQSSAAWCAGAAQAGASVPHAAPVQEQSLPFQLLGAGAAIDLHGIENSASIGTGIRADEAITAARLRLRLNWSPALLGELSHLRIALNGRVVAALPLPRDQGGRIVERVVELDPRDFSGYNSIRFDLIGHYSTDCEDPQHTAIWISIGADSALELGLRARPLANDLALLPAPFFDRHDARRLELPVVLAAAPAQDTVRSAAVAASWFGMLADYRGARFPVSLGTLPAGRALVLLANGEHVAGLDLPDVDAPTLTMMDHPAQANAKLLVIRGRDAAQLRQAVEGLVAGSQVLSGESATIRAVSLPRHVPYDAPRWLRTDAPVRLGQLVDSPAQLQSLGYAPQPIRISMRLPPDLLAWNNSGVPVDLRYRYTSPVVRDSSALQVGLNGQLVKSLHLRPDPEGGGSGRLLVPLLQPALVQDRGGFRIPAFQLGSVNQLQLQFATEYHRDGLCKSMFIDNARGAIDPDSTIDFSGLPHYATLPDLALFANAGFPFTRLADLGETTVVVAEPYSAAGLEELFFVMGRMGRQTGSAATGFELADAAAGAKASGRDLLVLGGAQPNTLLAQWSQDRAVVLKDAERHLREGGDVTASAAGGSIGAIVGFESPLSGGRSVVAFEGAGAEASPMLLDALGDEGRVGQMRGGLVLVRGGEVQSYAADHVYHVGSLSWWALVWFFFADHPLLLLLLALVLIAGGVLLVHGWLQRRAARRLAGGAA
jgi:hypothetical protein